MKYFRLYDTKSFRKLWNGQPVAEHFVSHCNTRLYPFVKAARQEDSGKSSRLRGIVKGKLSLSNGYTHGMTIVALIQKL